jgi:hypothetical protein
LLSQFEDISAQVRQYETFTDRWGYECPRYYAVDVQENEVIVVDAQNNYHYFGLSFTMNGDKAEIDFESAKRKKLRYEDYEDGSSIDGAFDFGKHIEEIENNAFAKVEDANAKISEAEGKISDYEAKVSEVETAKNEIEEKFNKVNAEFEEMKPKYEDFVKAEQARIEAELDAQKDAEFAKYESVLADDVDFAALKKELASLDNKIESLTTAPSSITTSRPNKELIQVPFITEPFAINEFLISAFFPYFAGGVSYVLVKIG